MEHKETIRNREIEHVLTTFKNAAECISRGICQPDEANIVISKYYIVFISEYASERGEVKLMREGKSLYVEVRAGNSRLVTDDWDMFVLNKRTVSPRLTIGNETFTKDEFIEFVRKGFQSILRTWV
jgi:hypothetical protein